MMVDNECEKSVLLEEAISVAKSRGFSDSIIESYMRELLNQGLCEAEIANRLKNLIFIHSLSCDISGGLDRLLG